MSIITKEGMTMYKPSLQYLNSLLLNSEVIALLVGFVLDVLSDRALTDSSLDPFAEAALDLVALPWRNVGVEQNVDLLQGLAMGFRVHKENVESHGEAENTENDISLPLDVGEGRSNEVCLGNISCTQAKWCNGNLQEQS